jgi:hypothetical protein
MIGQGMRAAVLGVGMAAIVGLSTANAQAGPPIRVARTTGTSGPQAGGMGMGAMALPERTTFPITGLGAGAAMPNLGAVGSGWLPNPFGPYPYPYPYRYAYPYPYPPVNPYGWWPMPSYGVYYQINIPYYPPGLF